jgi:hypothetical protein
MRAKGFGRDRCEPTVMTAHCCGIEWSGRRIAQRRHISARRAPVNELRYPATSFEDAAIDDGATVLMLTGGGMPST